MPAKKTTENKELAFEQSLERLNQIADILENGSSTLEDSLSLYEEGAALLKDCMEKLKTAEAKINLLSKGE